MLMSLCEKSVDVICRPRSSSSSSSRMTSGVQLKLQLPRHHTAVTRRHRNRTVISSTSLRQAPALLARRVLRLAQAASLDGSSRQSSDHLYRSTAPLRLSTQQQSCQQMCQWAPCGACLIITSCM